MSIGKSGFEVVRQFPALFAGVSFVSCSAGILVCYFIQKVFKPSFQPCGQRSMQLLDYRASDTRRRQSGVTVWQVVTRIVWTKLFKTESLHLNHIEQAFQQAGPETLCKKLVREMQAYGKAGWLTVFTKTNDLDSELRFFYEANLPKEMAKQRQDVLKLVLYLNDLRHNKRRVISIYPHFGTIVKTVVGSSIKILSERHVFCIEKICEFLDALDQEEELDLLQAFFETHPILFETFVQVFAPEGRFFENLQFDTMIADLHVAHGNLLQNSEFKESDTEAPTSLNSQLMERMVLITPANLKKTIADSMDAFNKTTIPKKIRNLYKQDITDQAIRWHSNCYQEQWSIYSLNIYLIAIQRAWEGYKIQRAESSKTLGSPASVLNSCAEEFMNIQIPEQKKRIIKEVSTVCFKEYIQQSLKEGSPEWEAEKLNQCVLQLADLLDPLKPMFESDTPSQDKIDAAKTLQNIKWLVIDVRQLVCQGTNLDLVCTIIRDFCQGNFLFLRQRDEMHQLRTVLQQMGHRPPSRTIIQYKEVKPSAASTGSSAQHRLAVIEMIQANPFLCLSRFVIPFIKSLVPKEGQEIIHRLEKHQDILKILFDNSDLKQEIVNIFTDAFIATSLEEHGLETSSQFLRKVNEKAQALLQNVAEGKAKLGHTPTTEEPLHLLIQKIDSAQKLRKELIAKGELFEGDRRKAYLEVVQKAEKIQVWLIHDLPNEVQNMSTTLRTLSFACSFLGFSVGPFNIGTPVMTRMLSILGAILKWDGVWNSVIEKLCKDDPNAPLADLLEGFLPEEKMAFINFLQDCIMPLITTVTPILQQRHNNLKKYQDFFVYLNGIMQSMNDINKRVLEKRLTQVIRLMLSEIKEYGPQLDAAFQSLWQSELEVEVQD
jgi:hypothetical protein